MIDPRPAKTRTFWSQLHWLIAGVAIATVLAFAPVYAAAQDEDPADAGPQPGAIGEPVEPLTDKRVYDMANLLNNSQENAIESDAARLERNGVPSVVIVMASDMNPDQAAAFGADVRQEWDIESAPDADDGLVMLVVVDLTDEKNIFSVMAWGEGAFPHFGLDQERSSQIKADWLDAYLNAGHIYDGILSTYRRLIYHSIYDPAPQAPITDAQSAMQTVVDWTAPLLALGGLIAGGMQWLRVPATRERRFQQVVTFGIPTVTALVAVASVWSHSGVGVVSTLVLIAVACASWITRDPSTTQFDQPVRGGAPS